MDRRTFLKTVAGFSLGMTGAQLALPYKAKCKMAKPVADLVATTWLDGRIRENIARLKKEKPWIKIGDTHCHTIYSDGNATVRALMNRASELGLDFLVITEHLTPNMYSLEHCLASINERRRCVHEWNNNSCAPVEVFPAFEISTLQGHIILVFDREFLKPEKFRDLKLQFARFDNKMESMEKTAQLVKPFDGITIIAHPEIKRSYPFGVSIAFAKQNLMGLVDAVEDVSAGHGYVESYSDELEMASIGSSDDHFNILLGTTVTAYDGRRHKDFISAVKARGTQAVKIESSLDPMLSAARLVF